jgi:GNAT superfamily N-acetyltransferase
MEIRPAESTDIPAIVELLKLSLGESLLPKSETYWRWKHVDNPFGPSPVLLAFEGPKLIGVRAFMRWDWISGTDRYHAVRAVDTATHPDHQGKGIFKKLTLKLVEESKSSGVHFVFNTPNTQSRPGYLKMEWKDAGRLPVRFIPLNPFGRLAVRLVSSPKSPVPFPQWLRSSAASVFFKQLDEDVTPNDLLATPLNERYLAWRYGSVPVVEYFALSNVDQNENELLIYRFKPGKFRKELRITEYINTNGRSMSQLMIRSLKRVAHFAGATHLTITGTKAALSQGITLHKGPIVTVRPLAQTDIRPLLGFNKWTPTLGDLELF